VIPCANGTDALQTMMGLDLKPVMSYYWFYICSNCWSGCPVAINTCFGRCWSVQYEYLYWPN
jgi:hypothetical protein